MQLGLGPVPVEGVVAPKSAVPHEKRSRSRPSVDPSASSSILLYGFVVGRGAPSDCITRMVEGESVMVVSILRWATVLVVAAAESGRDRAATAMYEARAPGVVRDVPVSAPKARRRPPTMILATPPISDRTRSAARRVFPSVSCSWIRVPAFAELKAR